MRVRRIATAPNTVPTRPASSERNSPLAPLSEADGARAHVRFDAPAPATLSSVRIVEPIDSGPRTKSSSVTTGSANWPNSGTSGERRCAYWSRTKTACSRSASDPGKRHDLLGPRIGGSANHRRLKTAAERCTPHNTSHVHACIPLRPCLVGRDRELAKKLLLRIADGPDLCLRECRPGELLSPEGRVRHHPCRHQQREALRP